MFTNDQLTRYHRDGFVVVEQLFDNEEADLLLKIPGLDGYLRSYQRDRVSTFEALMDHGSLRAYAESNNVL